MAPVIAIDPGNEQSAFVVWRSGVLVTFAKWENERVLELLRGPIKEFGIKNLVIEQIASYGMAVGAEVFETVFWSGRFAQAFPGEFERIPRLKVKLHLCKDSRAKDGNIRQAIIDRFGGKERAIGTKKNAGPLYGVSGDCWAALAVAITWADQREVGLR